MSAASVYTYVGSDAAPIAGTLSALLAAGSVTTAFVERVDFAGFVSAKEVSEPHTGEIVRVFGPNVELWWRFEPSLSGQAGGRFHARLITDAPDFHQAETAFVKAADLADEIEQRHYLLWGERNGDGLWRNGRIPKTITYPVSEEATRNKPGMRLEVRLYRVNDADGNPEVVPSLTCYQRLVPTTEGD